MLKASPLKRISFFLLSDIIISLFTLYFAYNLRFNFQIPSNFIDNFFSIFIILFSMKILVFLYFRLYRTAWRFFSLHEVKKILLAHIIVYTIFFIIFLIFKENMQPLARSIIIIDFMLSLVFITLLRLSKRIILESAGSTKYKNTLIIGANSTVKNLFCDKKNFHYTPVAIIDENKILKNTYIFDLRVYDFEDLKKVVKTKSIEAAIISKDYSQKELIAIYEKLNALNILDIKIINTLSSNDKKELKDIGVEDLLARHPKDLDKNQIENFIKDKVVLITGAGGSIGSEISRQCKAYGAKQLILLDHSEFNLYSIMEELKDENVIPVMQTVRKTEFLERTFAKYKPQIVIHAAAYKHVPLVEHNILEGISNNIIGTKNCIDLSIKYEVEKFVLISTDKAVRPTNVMGTTKRVCELYAQNVDSKNTEIVAVRFGNVLGSSGSVIPKFKAQIEAGGPITVTHPDITRYFMLIPEACELVLQAASIGKGGEIFILDMGEPIKIVDLAKKMIELSGRNEINIEFCGLRPGEKLYEELLINDSDQKTKYESITVASSTNFDINKLNQKIEELLVCEDKIAKLKEIVPEFNHQLNL
ncbi:polysaccharide biosynthesis protein [Arcobacter ellisii]|uniref:NDP-sugar epimerase, putative UDP-GlcNAc-inverting 4,6-dehydratase FlaA1 n=1 Tax=Arcobacter ellisii TaxID=913109 RepID=A0A347UAK3_9BACT|nr:nucleoside-diphosphate sugar epimerase/dehydratase [Arcobacter ellisii]AXX95881.1 NDP-sugar epimerase, putative UDP-GlcNAc-inverting 4,6-dehydratase FlaA1 [Arcobacter ellisii]RXI29739.1 dTDP-glucose 4,6-dehydratase [Arcobacter ellisii]